MKKVLKLMAALGIISLMISFVSCSLLTEAELKVRNNEQPNNGGPATGGGSDTIGNAWGSLFSNTNHSPIDLQVWKGFEAKPDGDNGLKATVNGDEWFGGAIVQNFNPEPVDSVCYNMSAVKKVTFKVKASKNISIWAGYSTVSKSGDHIEQPINATTDWQDVTINQQGVPEAWAIFAFGGPANSKGTTIYFKDITYLDSNGESVTLKYVQ